MKDFVETMKCNGKEFKVFSYVTMNAGGELLVFTDCCRDIFEQMGFNMKAVAKMVETSMGEEIGWVLPKDNILNLQGGIISPKNIVNLPWGGCIGESLELITEFELIRDTKINDMIDFIKSYGLSYLPVYRNIFQLDSTGLHSQESIAFIYMGIEDGIGYSFIKYNGNYYDSSAITDEYHVNKIQIIQFNDEENNIIVDCIVDVLQNDDGKLNDLPNNCVPRYNGEVIKTPKFIMCKSKTNDNNQNYYLTISPVYTDDEENPKCITWTNIAYLDKLWDKLVSLNYEVNKIEIETDMNQ